MASFVVGDTANNNQKTSNKAITFTSQSFNRDAAALPVNGVSSSTMNASSSSSSSYFPSKKGSGSGDNNNNKEKTDVTSVVAGLLLEIGFIVVSTYLASVLIQRLLKGSGMGLSEDEEHNSVEGEKRLQKLLKKSGKNRPSLTSFERQIAQDVVDPSDITVEFADIGGLDDTKEEIWQLAVLPLKRPDLFASSSLLQQPGGILLYGPPGTGKTMLAKAIAKEADATFLAVKLSKIMSKWFGESNKLIDAIFSLANKLAPSIIFIDEIDTFLNPRDGAENSAGNAIKAEFLTLWDGITTRKKAGGDDNDDDGDDDGYAPVMVLGATNRPNHVDNAILRRLPRMFRIELPDEAGRLQIITLTLKNSKHPVDADVVPFLPQLAKATRGYSGSDLKELLNCAALESVREVMKEESRRAVSERQAAPKTTPTKGKVNNNKKKRNHKKSKMTTTTAADDATSATTATPKSKIRPMSVQDLHVAMTKVKRTGQDAAEYERTQFERDHPNSRQVGNPDGHVNTERLLQVLFQQLAASSRNDGGGGGGGYNNSNNSNNNNNDDGGDIPDI
jgi:SpoVK/Ycf46/Vps4 family AAA+-type ATPase